LELTLFTNNNRYNNTVMNGTTNPDNPFENANAPVHYVSGNPSNAEGTSVLESPKQPWTYIASEKRRR